MTNRKFLKLGGVFAALLMVASMLAVVPAEARMGGSFGSRGMRTFQSAPITRVAPNVVAPVNRTMTPNPGPVSPGVTAGAAAQNFGNRGGFFSGLGGGILGGMLGGLLFHGLFGSMLGFGFGGFGGGLSLVFQLLLIGGLVWLALRFFRNRQPAGAPGFGTAFPFNNGSADRGPGGYGGGSGNAGYGGDSSGSSDEVGITNTDLETFETILADVQNAYSREDHQGLRRFTTPEMVSYLSEELAENATHGMRNDVTDLKFLEGDLAEAWREGTRDYATVAMHWSAIDLMRDRQTGAVVKGDSNQPVEARELWTFVRDRGGPWLLSAIQDARG
jgi:predicted lipid-binding transport protein (Tim44 family)